jgi:hypothetical protein
MSKTLDEIRKKLQALDTKKGGGNFGSGNKATYAHWNIAEGTSAILRFLPDGNEDNTFFWVERQLIKLPFPGVKGHDEHKPVIVEVPCIEMWDGRNTCPILNEVRPMWKDKSLEETARKYWVKKTYYAQGFVEQDPTNEQDSPENPIRKFIIGPQIFAIIKAALMDPDMENSPVDYINGTNFIVSKTSKGGFSDYGTSKWARKESSLSPDQQAAVAQHGLVDLSTYLPKRPSAEALAAMFEMFEASLNGDLYDPAKWAQFYKPWGFDSAPNQDDAVGTVVRRPVINAPAPSAPAAVQTRPVVEVEPEDDDAPFDGGTKIPESASNPAPAKSPQEILAMLRNRNAK